MPPKEPPAFCLDNEALLSDTLHDCLLGYGLLVKIVWGMQRRHRGSLRYIAAGRFGKTAGIVGEDVSIVRSARNRYIRLARVDEVGMHSAVDVYQDALGGQPLRAMAGHGIAMIEMGHSFRIEVDCLIAFG